MQSARRCARCFSTVPDSSRRAPPISRRYSPADSRMNAPLGEQAVTMQPPGGRPSFTLKSLAMRRPGIAAGFLALALVADPARAEPLACRREIAKQSARYVQSVVKARERCADRVIAGRLPPATDCRSEPPTALRLASAAEKASAGVV